MAILEVHHRTVYRYTRPVRFGDHRWMFRPRDSQDQRLVSVERTVVPDPSDVTWVHDVFGNQIAIVQFAAEAAELTFESNIVLDHTSPKIPRATIDDDARAWPFSYDAATLPDLEPFRRIHYPDPSVADWARRIVPSGSRGDTMKLLTTLNDAVRKTCTYVRRTEPGTQEPAHTLSRRAGTCRDFALLMMEAARSLGFGARFVTGYIYVPARDAQTVRGGGATHAWVQIFLPGAGWVEFDPTNGIVGSRDLIRVGVARDPRQAKPLSGSFTGPRAAFLGMEVDVLVRRHTGSLPPLGDMAAALTSPSEDDAS